MGAEAEIRKAGDLDFGVAWDGDYDRCFFLDGRGNFIEGYYIVGLLAQALLHDGPSRIVYDPRLTWNTVDVVERMGGEPVICKSGHAFIKEKMREVDAIYGGEMSAHPLLQGALVLRLGHDPVPARRSTRLPDGQKARRPRRTR